MRCFEMVSGVTCGDQDCTLNSWGEEGTHFKSRANTRSLLLDLEPSMTKLPLVPLILESRNTTSIVPPNGVTKIESNYDKSKDDDANLLVRHRQSKSCLILSNNDINQELREDDQTTLADGPLASFEDFDSNDINSLCIVLEANSDQIALDFIEKNKSVPRSKKSNTWKSSIKSEVVEDVVSLEENGEAVKNIEGSERKFSASLLEGSEEMKMHMQKSRLNFPPLWGLTSICGRRSEMEDSVVVLPRFLEIPSQMLNDSTLFGSEHQDLTAHVFGVFDGHGGCQVANYCRDNLHLVLAEEISFAETNFLIENGEHNWKERWMKVFLNCFRKLDDEVGGFPRANGSNASEPPALPIAPDSVGSTAVVAIVCSTHIIVANCGDSRAVLCRGKASVPLTVDHKPNREDECARIEAAGGKVINWDGYRVSGVLAMSRSIGDRYLRPYVIADPELMFVPRAKEDECLIIASDGLWDVITNEEACDLARRRITLWHRKNDATLLRERGEEIDPAAQDAAEYLSRLSFHRGSKDNISVIVVDLKAQRKAKKKS